MKNKLKAHLKTIGTMLAIVGVSLMLVLLPQVLLLLIGTSFIYWVLYDGFSKDN
jgi:heme O synthase-like polyprenyltransferase